ncbi:TPA: hypothetical protein ACHWCH_001992, partial [Streptococcus suis]
SFSNKIDKSYVRYDFNISYAVCKRKTATSSSVRDKRGATSSFVIFVSNRRWINSERLVSEI